LVPARTVKLIHGQQRKDDGRMAKTTDMLIDRADQVRPYVDRALHDEELRDNLKEAFTTARGLYDELIGNRGAFGVAQRVAGDKDIQENLKKTVEELRAAAERLQGKEDHSARNRLLLLTGITIGILFNPFTGPQTRKWIGDKVLGGDDYDYAATTPPAATNSGSSATAPAASTSEAS
jgi:hypothetical protein